MHKPRYLADDGWTQAWGISWCANRRDDVSWIQHSGWLPGFTTSICFDPGTGVGAIALLNGTSGTADLALELASIARRLARSAPPPITAPAPTPAKYRPLLGIYTPSDLGSWVMLLEWRDGQLAFTSPDLPTWQQVLEPTGDADVFIAAPGSDFSGEKVIFQRRADGYASSVLLVQSTLLRLDHPTPPG
jgi:CubicO group peptidase (beta-lactamase class C family)